jgi:type I restriction enzyme S subunit
MTAQTDSRVPKIRFKGFEGEWVEKTLGQLCEPLSYGLNAAATKYDGENKYLRITDIDDETRVFLQKDITSPKKDLTGLESFMLETGDLVFARTGASVGKTYLYKIEDGRVFFAGFLIRAKTKADVDESFIFQSTLTSNYGTFVKLTSQRSGQPGINAQEYSSFSLNCPDPAEQTQIGSYFRELDRLIGLQQVKHDKLVTLKKAMLQKMFPQPGSTTPEIRFKGFEGEWVEKKLGELATFSKGLGYSKRDLTASGTPIVLYGRLYLAYQTEITVVDTFVTEKPGSVKSTGKEVVVPASGETAEDIARASAIGIGGILLGGDLNIILPSDELTSVFLALNLSNGKPQRDLARRAQGKTVVHVRKGDLESLQILFPDPAEQTKIGSYFRTLDELISKHAIQLEKLKQIKSACLQKMFV